MKAYVFRGAPASGKGTLVKEFIKLIPRKVAYLELDNFRWGFHLYNRQVKDVTPDEHKFAYENFLMMLENYCRNGGYNLVIEGLFSWEKRGAHGNMQDIIEILERYRFDYKAFYLSADYKTLWERNIKRKHIVPEEEFMTLFNYVGESDATKEIILDVEKNSPEQILALLKRHL